MSRHRPEDLRTFVLGCLETAGGVVEFPEFGLAEALLPDAAAPAFGGRTFLRIAFDPEVAHEHPDAELVAYGSEFLDRLINVAAQRGLTTVRYIHVDRLEVTRAAERLMGQFQFINCRPSLDHSLIRSFAYLLFHFKLIYLTDEREEAFHAVLVNLNTNCHVEDTERFLRVAPTAQFRPIVCPEEPVCSVRAAYLTACASLRQQADRTFRAKQGEARRQMEADHRRIDVYYNDLREETSRRIQRSGDPNRIDALGYRIQAYEVDRERRRKELEDKYSLRLHARLTSAVLYAQPKIIHFVGVSHRDRWFPLRFVWDPLFKTFEPPLCDLCGEELRTIALDKNGRIACWGKGPKQP